MKTLPKTILTAEQKARLDTIKEKLTAISDEINDIKVDATMYIVNHGLHEYESANECLRYLQSALFDIQDIKESLHYAKYE